MDKLTFLIDETHINNNSGTPEEWHEYMDYLDAIGYDLCDDNEPSYDPDSERGFQNLDTDILPW